MGSRIIERRLREIENELSRSLSQLDPAVEWNAKQLIRDKVLQVYKIGSDYACNHFHIEPFTAAEDFRDIGRIVDDTYRRWLYGRSLPSALIALTSITLAKATKSKAAQIVTANKLTNTVTPLPMNQGIDNLNLALEQPADPEPLDPTDPFLDMGDMLDATPLSEEDQPVEEDQQQQQQDVLVWETEGDDRVCPECDALDGQEWNADDPSIPEPVISTHESCRCRLVLSTGDETSSL